MKILSVYGIPIKIHFTLAICLVLLAGLGYYEGGSSGLMRGALLTFALFLSVTLHELGHAMAAKYFNIDTYDITLYPFGGIARIKSKDFSSKEELVVAVAGPLTNLFLVLLSMPFVYFNVFGSALFLLLNALMCVFNMIPAYPMDGGRILRSMLSRKMDRDKATIISIKVSKIFSILFFLISAYYNAISLFVIGIFLLVATRPEEKILRSRMAK